MAREEITDESRKEYGYRQTLIFQLNRIAQIVSFIRSTGYNKNAFRTLENAIDMLEIMIIPYFDKDYKKPNGFPRMTTGDNATYEKLYEKRMEQLGELMKLMARNRLLLEAETYDEWY